jgi:signal transduction histidine kinase
MRAFRLLRLSPVRYALAFAGVATVVMGVLLLVIYWSMISLLERHLDETIEQQLEVLRNDFRQDGRDAVIRLVRQHEERNRDSPVHFLVLDGEDSVIAGDLPIVHSHKGWQIIPATRSQVSGDTLVRQLRGYGEMLDDETFVLVTHDTKDLHQTREFIIASFAVALALTVVLALGGGLLIGKALLRRVEDVNRTAHAIMEGDLSQRVPVVGRGDELGGLAESLNRMLARIQELMENLQQVSNDIAHDLRTPLGRLRQRLEACRRKTQTSVEYEAAIDAAIAESAMILETFDAMLRIAQIEAGARRARFTTVDLSGVVDNVVEAFSAAAEDEGKFIESAIESGMVLRGDRELLMQMLANVVENAIRHTPSGTRVQVCVERDDSCVRLIVSDDGPGIRAGDRERVLRRFYRLDTSRVTPGSGLGMSLVAAVTKLHDADLSLSDNDPGLRVSITFPASGDKVPGAVPKEGERSPGGPFEVRMTKEQTFHGLGLK